MQRVLKAAEMREVDRLTTEHAGIPGLLLMENAAAQVVRAIEDAFAPIGRERIVVLCGKGANGGDGLAVARQLHVQGLAGEVEAALVADPSDLVVDAATNWAMARGTSVRLTVIEDIDTWRTFRERVARATLVVDALLGTGIKGPARGLIGEVVADLGEGFDHVRFVAVDMPSGMGSDGGDPLEPRCKADLTVTFTAPKVSQVTAPAGDLGELRVVPIGTPSELFDELDSTPLLLVEPSDAAVLTASRAGDAHKGSYGHVGIVGGSRSKPGAAIMAGMGAARAGAGLTTVVTAASATSSVVATVPELMTLPIAEAADGSMQSDELKSSSLDGFSVVVLGPGLGVSDDARQLCRNLFKAATQPIVVDADGLTALGAHADWSSASSVIVLTPHPGEMARLLGITSAEVQSDRIGTARRYAGDHGAYVVLKGSRTVIAAPDGRVLVNPTGGPGMASGGSGDVLAGMIGGMLAQFPDLDPLLVLGGTVYLHGLAADLAVEELSEQSLLATDILEYLPQAIHQVRTD